MPRFSRLLLLAVLGLSALSVHAQGVLSFERMEHDFGSITEGDKPTYTFLFTNTGDEPVRLTDVRPSCGCTAPSYSTEAIEPGAQGEITVEYNSQGRPGPFEKSISVGAEGAEPEFTNIYIVGTVVPVNILGGDRQGDVVFDADMHTFGSLQPSDPIVHTFKMQNTGESVLRINGARTFQDGVFVDHPTAAIFPGDIVQIRVSVPDASVLGSASRFDVAVVLDTDDVNTPVKSLRMRGQIERTESMVSTQ